MWSYPYNTNFCFSATASSLIIIAESPLLFHDRGFILDAAVGGSNCTPATTVNYYYTNAIFRVKPSDFHFNALKFIFRVKSLRRSALRMLRVDLNDRVVSIFFLFDTCLYFERKFHWKLYSQEALLLKALNSDDISLPILAIITLEMFLLLYFCCNIIYRKYYTLFFLAYLISVSNLSFKENMKFILFILFSFFFNLSILAQLYLLLFQKRCLEKINQNLYLSD